ncbi:vacuolar protein sorting-associated protein 32 homolog 1-like [Papaver somniferum]|uniref:vacuolar protein sorting-associated protein 32 homolog 1-like n=1 Tax=Papaver somniferum TaxID=3469 RepID=UPI000E7056FB|nr:vacuolar protein sorting-associated protein 32 homolog 1-like [Papaver somniferum]
MEAVIAKPCLRFCNMSKDLKSQKMKMEAEERLKYCKYLLQALLPVLNQIHEEQAMEKELEANIQVECTRLQSSCCTSSFLHKETQMMDEIIEKIGNMKQDKLESELEELEGTELEEQLLQPATMIIML